MADGDERTARRDHPPPARAQRALDAAVRRHGRDLQPVPVADRARPARALRAGAGGHRSRCACPPTRSTSRPACAIDEERADARRRRGHPRRPALTGRQRQALIEVYEAFAASSGAASAGAGAARAGEPPTRPTSGGRALTSYGAGIAGARAGSALGAPLARGAGVGGECSSTSAMIGGQWSRSASRPMNRPRWPPLRACARGCPRAGCRRASARAKTCAGGVMWSLCAGQQVERARRCATRSTRSPPTSSVPATSSLSRNRCSHDPQVEGAGQVLGVLEPVLEQPVALDVVGLVQVGEELELLLELVLGLDGDEAAEDELALQHAVAERRRASRRRSGRRRTSAATHSWMTASPAWKSIGAPAMVSVLTCSGCSAA